MGLSELPPEILQEILIHAVNVRGVKRALRLRLVNHLYSKEVEKALFNSFVLEEYVQQGKAGGGFRPWQNQFWQSYLFYSILKNRKSLQGRQQVIYDMAECLAEQTGNNSLESVREYLWALCSRPCPILSSRPFVRNQRRNPKYLLQAAIINQCPAVVKKILSFPNTPREILDHFEEDVWLPPLHLAGRNGNLEVIEILLSTTRHRPGEEMREEALSGAVSCGNLEAIEFIMDPRWGPINFFSSSHSVDEHLTLGLVRSNLPDFCRQLFALFKKRSTVEYPIEISPPEIDLLLCHIAGDPREHVDVMEYLLDHWRTLQQNDGFTQHRLAWSRDPAPYQSMTDEDCRDRALLWKALREAVKGCNAKVVRLLLDRGATPKDADDDVLCYAAGTGCLELVQLLVEHGADVNCTPRPKWDTALGRFQKLRSPIAEALGVEHEQMTRYLHERGATVSESNVEKRDGLGRRDGLETVIEMTEKLIQCQEGLAWCGSCKCKSYGSDAASEVV